MAYAVRQVNRNKTYVYIAKNIYRPELKQSRQVREYVGTLDDEDNLTLGKNVSPLDKETVRLLECAGIKYDPSRRHQRVRCKCGTILVDGNCPLCSGAVKGVERIGAKHLFEELSSDLKLDQCLRKAFGKKMSDLFFLALYRSVTGKPLYLAAPWLNSAGVDGSFSSGTISRLLREIGADGSSREKFLLHWCKALGGSPELICDITSISTYSDRLSLAEWGYNRDREKLPQLNIALISERGMDGMPVAYRILPGSVPDVSTLGNTSGFISSLGYKDSAFRLDKGFHSKANVLRMHREGRKFVIGVPFSLASVKKLFSKSLNSLKSGRRSFLWNGHVMRHVKKAMPYHDKHGTVNFNAHLYYEPERAADMKGDFERRMLSIENESKDMLFENRAEVKEWLYERAGRHADLFKISACGMCFRVERKPNAVARAMRFMGCTIILTNEMELDGEAVLDAYRSRDSVEKLFDTMKNENGQHRLRTGDNLIAEGQVFLSMLSLILRKGLEARMRISGLLKKYSVDALIAEIEKISVIKLTYGNDILMEITKKQREIFTKLAISLPQIT
jgi:hypothetical protein